MLRCTTKFSWGADPPTSLLFYRSYVRSIVDYGSILYGTAAKSHLSQLDRLQLKYLRIVLGAMRSTPCPILLAETSEPPLKWRRRYLAEKFITKLSFFDHGNILRNICKLTTCTLTEKYWKKKKDPLLCSAFLNVNKLHCDINNFDRFAIFNAPYEILTFSPAIMYPQYSM